MELAARTGKTQSYISKVITGDKKANLELVSQISSALGVSIAEFFSCFDGDESNLPEYLRAFMSQCRTLSRDEVRMLSSLITFLPSSSQALYCPHDLALLPILGDAAAGSPVYSPAFDGESVLVPARFANADEFFAIQAKGNSMTPLIMDGDFAIIRYGSVPEAGELVLVRGESLGEDEYVIKKLRRKGKTVTLISINADYPPMSVSSSKIRSMESVVHIIHSGTA